eukprot:TRINITY_DN6976_c1_g1_i1.p1 TRINITY_DN6976_c1_g1~~TRINITY_DN6976_c1_g1_i1.p1  ORF type:complete len:271 (+),score=51.26 TRINITY_DN6976_c1_g1_i1:48-860(+)
MSGPAPPRHLRGAFDFELTERNVREKLAVKHTSTGTTIVAVIFDGGVVAAADTRATAGDVIVDKVCHKVHRIADNIFACGAGTAADCDKVTSMCEAKLDFYKYENNREPRVVQAEQILKTHLSRYGGYLGAYLIVGGIDVTGPKLSFISANGFQKQSLFEASGSGSMAAEAILETKFRQNMPEEEAVALAREAIAAGINYDQGSGGSVRIKIFKRVEGATKVVELPMENIAWRLRKDPPRMQFKESDTNVTKRVYEKMVIGDPEPMEIDA